MRTRQPVWANADGPEYEALRLLPPDEAQRVWRDAGQRALTSPRFWVGMYAVGAPVGLFAFGVLAVSVWLGLGLVGKIALEVAAHVALGLVAHRPLTRAMTSLYRPLVRTQLLADYAD